MSEHTTATCVLERFPSNQKQIVRLFETDDDFRELCLHFAECQTALSKLEGSVASNRAHIDEYRTLIDELEREIRLEILRVP